MSARTRSRIGPRVVGALAAASLAAAGVAGLSASAQTPTISPNAIQPETTITLNGHGGVDHAPDIAHISVGVSIDAETASAAMSQQAAKMTGVFNAVKASGVADRDMQTSNLSLNPNYSYPEKLPPKLIGYKASNQLTIRVRDLKNLGKTLDAIVKSGGNTINGISFDIDKPEPLQNEARVAAIKDAAEKADLYAKAVGYRVKRIVTVSESGGYQPPRPVVMARMAQAAPSTPVAAGELTIDADVNVTFELVK
ncbi:MAG: SIMPL domain-containing protein [Alphaproteobacteria bacterium]